jgi:diacylglycerol kinase family enzyme
MQKGIVSENLWMIRRENMRIALIAKPLTGPRNKSNDISQAVDQLAACHIHCEVFETQYHAQALKIVKGLPLSQFDALIAMGGDGTNYHLLNGVLKFHGDRVIPPLGLMYLHPGCHVDIDV